MNVRRIFRLTLKIVGGFLLFVIIYFIAAFGLSYLTSNSDFKQCGKDAVEVYVLTNGIHTDIVCPLKNQYKDWSSLADPADTPSGDTTADLAAFGWGDKGFYLETKTWDELKFSTAFKAMFFLSSSAMHVSFYKKLTVGESCKKICISKESYLQLVDYIAASFDTDSLGNSIRIPDASYRDNDSFYEAKRTYNLFYTCNTWANSGLKSAGLKACMWTPFTKGILSKY